MNTNRGPAKYEIGQRIVVDTIEHGEFHGSVTDVQWETGAWLYELELDTGAEMKARPWDMEAE